jgi:myo-inositol-1(or 4)-monophosphatase
MDLCYVASGAIDFYYECPLEPWDLAAGRVIAEAAGASVVVGTAAGFSGTGVVAANPVLMARALPMLRDAGLDFLSATD